MGKIKSQGSAWQWTRRGLLNAMTVALSGVSAPNAGAKPKHKLRVRLGVDSHTLRDFHWNAFGLLDYAAGMRLNTVQFTDLLHIGTLEEVRNNSYLRRVRVRAEELGIGLEMGIRGVCPPLPNFDPKYGTAPEQLGLAIRIAKILGARSVRCVMGQAKFRREYGPFEQYIGPMIDVCQAVRDEALRAGVKIAVETHQDLRATALRELVRTAGTDYVGVCYDSGNAMYVLEDPLDTLEILAPHIVTSHIRDSALWKHPRGAVFQWTAMGDGSVGIDRVVHRFCELCPEVSLNLEIITGDPPEILNYMEAEFWPTFETVPASEFVRFLKRVEEGVPPMAGMIVPANAPNDPSYKEAYRQQQKVDFERSVKYCREVLGISWGA